MFVNSSGIIPVLIEICCKISSRQFSSHVSVMFSDLVPSYPLCYICFHFQGAKILHVKFDPIKIYSQ